MGNDAIEEAAARWFARRNAGLWTETDQRRFDAWRVEHAAHRIAYVRLEAAWKHAARLQALGAHVPPGVIPPRGSWGDKHYSLAGLVGYDPPSPPSPPRLGVAAHRQPVRWSAIAAGLVLLLSVGASVHELTVPAAGAEARYTTPIGGIDHVQLADGSRVTLNTDTSIRVTLTGHYRRVQLDHGEAFFEVAKDKARPFVVYAGNKSVMAVGTKFAVRRDESDIQVVVTEGRVNFAEVPASLVAAQGKGRTVSHASATLLPATVDPVAADSASPSTYLSAGDVALASKSDVLVRTNVESDAERLLSWRSGYLIFDNTMLADAVAEFNRYSTRKILIEDPAIASIRIGGNFRSTNIEGFLWLLQNGFPIAVESRDDKVVLKAG